MKPICTFPLLAALLFTAGCTKESSTAEPAPGAPKAGGDGQQHGAMADLGFTQIGEFPVKAKRSKIEPGVEVEIDLEFPAGKALPPIVRGWIGTQDGVGSVKATFGAEGERGMHAHLDVPKPLPAGSKLWVEIEPAGAAKVAGAFNLDG